MIATGTPTSMLGSSRSFLPRTIRLAMLLLLCLVTSLSFVGAEGSPCRPDCTHCQWAMSCCDGKKASGQPLSENRMDPVAGERCGSGSCQGNMCDDVSFNTDAAGLAGLSLTSGVLPAGYSVQHGPLVHSSRVWCGSVLRSTVISPRPLFLRHCSLLI